ncbi:AAA family ATPase [Psychromonas sp. psych-6C06]|uniref:UvrD-helicase domain-containing protein n=1 Tax=Psychromonas sp. psych-6C06 TaxID=2058089 RepID=UPI000C33E44F|nr:UvrD-helicase domain-containing protein [Psychromonas sp. psych-6C06]PKF63760.1 AAA family ATPase [Psychromonas sp. psych-6C06]
MFSVKSNILGQLFGNPTRINIDSQAIKVTIGKEQQTIPWQSLSTPPVFLSTLLGHHISFDTDDNTVQLSKLSARGIKEFKQQCQTYWIAVHQHKLQLLLGKIKPLISKRYLRESTLNAIKGNINRLYQQWFPWSESAPALSDKTQQLLMQLTIYQHWNADDITHCRETYIQSQLKLHQAFFDNVESNPLTQAQRRACIIDDDNNLLLAGAGTGKTSVMVGRTAYLLNSEQATHSNILLLAYGKKAAKEMDQRIKEKLATDKIKASTFHSLGLRIIAQVEGAMPSLSPFVEDEKAKAKWVQQCFEQLISSDKAYRQSVLTYFSQYYYVEKSPFAFPTLGDYYQYLSDNDIRTLKGEKVKSFGELHIANWLFNHGIAYQYEAKYHVALNTLERKQYQPDFFIPEFNIYIEYYGIDENGDSAPYIDKQQYHDAINWKRETHQQHGSECIELSYAELKQGKLLATLEKLLNKKGIKYNKLPDEVMLANLKETGRITELAQIFSTLLGLYKGACLTEALAQNIIEQALDSKQTEKAFELLKPILSAYQTLLSSRHEIDFEDMISKAIEYVQKGQFTSPWRYIMVDEFQDISEPRARLVKALRDNHRGSSLFAVGDDWQAIYRFSGADVSLTTQFSDYFGATTQTQLDTTFRFNDRIGQVATQFVCQNPTQIKKIINSHSKVSKPAVSLLRKGAVTQAKSHDDDAIDEMVNGALDQVLKAISQQVTQTASVYLLARNWFQLPNKKALAQLNQQYPLLNIENQSFHSSKGKEADFVVIVGLKKGKQGFPSNKATPAIIDALLAKQESFVHAEERRLFYVALTRAKHRAYLIADMSNNSEFVSELIENYDIELNEFAITMNQAFVKQLNCLVCETGTLTPRNSRFGQFYGCTHFPRCDHKERGCKQCESAMSKQKHQGFKTCLNPSCLEIVPLCDKCGAEMVLRKGPKGEFWGCRNFKGNEPLSCKNGINKEALQWPV